MANWKLPPVPEGCQWCPYCQSTLPVADFEPSKYRACGRSLRCRPCLARERQDRREIVQTLDESGKRFAALHYRPNPPDEHYRPDPPGLPNGKLATEADFRRIDDFRRMERLRRPR